MKRILNILDYFFYHFFFTIFWLILIVHFTMRPTLFFSFLWAHNTFVRSYWAILEGQTAEYGIWPGLLKSMGHDFLWIFIILGAIIIPLTIAKSYFVKKTKIGESITEYLGTSILSLIITFIGGSIVMSIVATFLMSFGIFLFDSPISSEFEVIIEIAASGIIITDLLLCVALWSVNIPETEETTSVKKKPAKIFKSIPSLVSFILAVLLAIVISYTVKTRVTLVLPENKEDIRIYSYDLFNNKLPIKHEKYPDVYSVTLSPENKTTFDDDSLYTNLDMTRKSVFIHSRDLPFISYFKGFFHQRPDSIQFNYNEAAVEVFYRVRPYNELPRYIYTMTEKPDYRSKNVEVSCKDCKGDKFNTQNILKRGDNLFHTISITPKKKDEDTRWGAIVVQQKTRQMYLFAIEKQSFIFAVIDSNDAPYVHYTVKLDKIVKTLLIKDEETGLSLFIDGKPKFYCNLDFSEVDLFLQNISPEGGSKHGSFNVEIGSARYTGKQK